MSKYAYFGTVPLVHRHSPGDPNLSECRVGRRGLPTKQDSLMILSIKKPTYGRRFNTEIQWYHSLFIRVSGTN